MVDFEIAGLNSSNPEDWHKLANAYGRQELPTGGLPAIPDNAENSGSLDPSTFDVDTVITVITRSGTKYVLTVVEDGQVTIERFIWRVHGLRVGFLSYEEDMAAYREQLDWHNKHVELAKQGFYVHVPDLRTEPWKFDSRPFVVDPLRANEVMAVRYPKQGPLTYMKTSPVVFWTIDRP